MALLEVDATWNRIISVWWSLTWPFGLVFGVIIMGLQIESRFSFPLSPRFSLGIIFLFAVINLIVVRRVFYIRYPEFTVALLAIQWNIKVPLDVTWEHIIKVWWSLTWRISIVVYSVILLQLKSFGLLVIIMGTLIIVLKLFQLTYNKSRIVLLDAQQNITKYNKFRIALLDAQQNINDQHDHDTEANDLISMTMDQHDHDTEANDLISMTMDQHGQQKHIEAFKRALESHGFQAFEAGYLGRDSIIGYCMKNKLSFATYDITVDWLPYEPYNLEPEMPYGDRVDWGHNLALATLFVQYVSSESSKVHIISDTFIDEPSDRAFTILSSDWSRFASSDIMAFNQIGDILIFDESYCRVLIFFHHDQVHMVSLKEDAEKVMNDMRRLVDG